HGNDTRPHAMVSIPVATSTKAPADSSTIGAAHPSPASLLVSASASAAMLVASAASAVTSALATTSAGLPSNIAFESGIDGSGAASPSALGFRSSRRPSTPMGASGTGGWSVGASAVRCGSSSTTTERSSTLQLTMLPVMNAADARVSQDRYR